MSDERGREPPADHLLPGDAAAPSPEEGASQLRSDGPSAQRQLSAAGPTAIWLAVLLVIVVAGVALSPFWAPAVDPLLPWGVKTAATDKELAAVAARVTALERRPASPVVDVQALKSAQAGLARRIDGLETTVDGLRQNQAAAGATKQALAQLRQQLDASAAQSASRSAAETTDVAKLQQRLARLDSAAADHGARLAELERKVQAQSGGDRNGTMLLLALLQMREAVEQGRPFAAEYEGFRGLVRNDPKLLAAAQPLAEAAPDGVASRAELNRRLAALATQLSAAARPAATSATWWGQALDRMRRLVTIRRIGPGAKNGPEAQADAAQRALSRGDLAAAVSALAGLSGANAEAAHPWLEMARQRLAAEAALTRLQGLLVARLAAEPAPPPAVAPTPSKAVPPASPRVPS